MKLQGHYSAARIRHAHLAGRISGCAGPKVEAVGPVVEEITSDTTRLSPPTSRAARIGETPTLP